MKKIIISAVAVVIFTFSLVSCKTVEATVERQEVVININSGDFEYGAIVSAEWTVKLKDFKKDAQAISSAKSQALSKILSDNAAYDVLLFPKYDVTLKGSKVTVIARGRLAKIKE